MSGPLPSGAMRSLTSGQISVPTGQSAPSHNPSLEAGRARGRAAAVYGLAGLFLGSLIGELLVAALPPRIA
jgi:hypothetical protein